MIAVANAPPGAVRKRPHPVPDTAPPTPAEAIRQGVEMRFARIGETSAMDGTEGLTAGAPHKERRGDFTSLAAAEVVVAGGSTGRRPPTWRSKFHERRSGSREAGLELRSGRSQIVPSYPPAACCRLRGRSPERSQLQFALGADENALHISGFDRSEREPRLHPGLGREDARTESGRSLRCAASSRYRESRCLSASAASPGRPFAVRSRTNPCGEKGGFLYALRKARSTASASEG